MSKGSTSHALAARSLRSRIAVNTSWSRTGDRAARTAPARRAAFERFENEVDPQRQLPADERRRRAEYAQRAHMQRLALRSAEARRAKAGAS